MHTTRRPRLFPLLFLALAVAAAVRLAAIPRQQPPAGQAPAVGAGQSPQVTFRAEVNYVEVATVVVDKQGRFVPDLTQDDFQVFEDGKPQPISTFTLVNMPVNRPDKPLFAREAVEPDVQSNSTPFAGRLYLLLLDDLHTDFAYTQEVRRAAARFVDDVMRDGDVAAVAATSGRLDVAQDFTSSRRLLLRAVDRFQGRGLQSATVNKIESYAAARDMQGARAPAVRAPEDGQAPERAYNARTTLTVIRRLSDLLSGVRGRRKALVFFSPGIDYNIANAITSGWSGNEERGAPPPPGSGPTREVQLDAIDTIGSAARANVAIYSVDPRGLNAAATTAETPGFPADASPALEINAQAMQQEVAVQQDSLRALSDGSGGFATFNTNDLVSAFDRIRDDNSTYYVLGYSSPNTKRDGKFRSIEVRTRRPGLDVRARKGYTAPRGNAPSPAKADEAKLPIPAPLRDALTSPLPVSGVRLAAQAAPFRGSPKPGVLLVVQVDGRDLAFKEEAGIFKGGVDLSVVALDGQGKANEALHREIPMPLKPESYKMVAQSGIRIVSRFELAPGRYQLRIAAMDLGRPPAGAVHYDVDVPDFAAQPFGMSGLVLTSSLAGMVPTAGSTAIEELRGKLPGPPTLSREFRAGEELALLAEIYDTQPGEHATDIVTTIRTDEGREIVRQEDQRTRAEFAAGNGTVAYTTRIPLAGAAPGLYVLRVEARSRLQATPVVREAQFRIVP